MDDTGDIVVEVTVEDVEVGAVNGVADIEVLDLVGVSVTTILHVLLSTTFLTCGRVLKFLA